jgi:hypothetical protein
MLRENLEGLKKLKGPNQVHNYADDVNFFGEVDKNSMKNKAEIVLRAESKYR